MLYSFLVRDKRQKRASWMAQYFEHVAVELLYLRL
jgi:hypothetical protein